MTADSKSRFLLFFNLPYTALADNSWDLKDTLNFFLVGLLTPSLCTDENSPGTSLPLHTATRVIFKWKQFSSPWRVCFALDSC